MLLYQLIVGTIIIFLPLLCMIFAHMNYCRSRIGVHSAEATHIMVTMVPHQDNIILYLFIDK